MAKGKGKKAVSNAKVDLNEVYLVQVKAKKNPDDNHIIAIGSKNISIEDGVVQVSKKHKKEIEMLVSKGSIRLFNKATIETGNVKIM